MKFRDLPMQEAILRLTAHAFVRDGADESVFKFHRSIAPAYEFYNNQRAKIVAAYGVKDGDGSYVITDDKREAYVSELNVLINSDVDFRVEELDLSEADFNSNQCRKPSDVALLLSSAEKEAILRLSEIIRKERKIKELNTIKGEIESTIGT